MAVAAPPCGSRDGAPADPGPGDDVGPATGRPRSHRRRWWRNDDAATPTRHADRTALRPALGTPTRRDRVLGWVGPLLVALVALALRAPRLGEPESEVFDEVYYPRDAEDLLAYGYASSDDDPGEPSFVVHPPLGKWLIAAGIRAVDAWPGEQATEVGWRASALVAGVLLVLVTARLGRRLTGSTVLGTLAGLLVAVDGMAIVDSRTALLDVFLALLVLMGAAALVVDRDRVRARLSAWAGARDGTADDDPTRTKTGPGLGVRPWRLAAGVLLGAACAVKWSAVAPLLLLAVWSLAQDRRARRAAGVDRPALAVLRRDVPLAAVSLGLVPVLAYAAGWTSWFVSDRAWDRTWAAGRDSDVSFVPEVLRSWWHHHGAVLDFHSGLADAHPYESRPAGWLLLARPVAYFYEGTDDVEAAQALCGADSCSTAVHAIGNPVLWWLGALALLAMAVRWVVTRDSAAGLVALMGLGQVLQWLPSDLQDRTMFNFYALPSVPFLALALALVAHLGLSRRREGLRRASAAATAVVALVAVVLTTGVPFVDVPGVGFLPVLTGEPVPYGTWRDLMWLPSWI